MQVQAINVAALVTDGLRDIGQRPYFIDQCDPDAGGEPLSFLGIAPSQIHPTFRFGIKFFQRVRKDWIDCNPVTRRNNTHNAFTRHSTCAQMDFENGAGSRTSDGNSQLAGFFAGCLASCGLDVGLIHGNTHGFQHVNSRELTLTHCCQDIVSIFLTQSRCGFGHQLVSKVYFVPFQQFFHHFLTETSELFALCRPCCTANGGFGFACNCDGFPSGRRHLRVGTDDADFVAVLQFGHQRGVATVDFTTYATVAHRGVNSIGKINRCSTPGQCNELSLRRETEHLVMEQFQTRVLQKLFGAVAFLQDFHQVPKPAIGI